MTNPFGIYVHVPFCTHRCSYCDFYTFTRHDTDDFEHFTYAVVREASQAAHWLKSKRGFSSRVTSIFFGGGTPSLLPVRMLQRICEGLCENFVVEEAAEITLEANPETITGRFCEDLLALTPVNRISLGAQSFKQENLTKLDRLGSRASIFRAVDLLNEHGLNHFNLDLMMGIPGQTIASFLDDIEVAIGLGPKHLSAYGLTLKEGHSLFSQLPAEDFSAEIYSRGVERFEERGFLQYEISNFSRPGFQCRHNLLYWDGGDFLGIGPSSASRFFWEDRFFHRKQPSDFKRYVALSEFPAPVFEETTRKQSILEAAFLELRKNAGVRIAKFERRYGYNLACARQYSLFLQEGFIHREGDTLRLSPKGRLLADRVTQELVDI